MTVAHVGSWCMAMMLTAPVLASAQDVPRIALAREYVGDDCVNGVVTIDRDFVAYMIATRYQNNPPRLAALLPGTFDAHISGSAAAGWDIGYNPDAGGGAVHLQLRRALVAGVDAIAIGDKLESNCRFSRDSEYGIAARAIEQRLEAFPPATGGKLDIRLKIEDR